MTTTGSSTAVTRVTVPSLPTTVDSSQMTFGDMLSMGEALVKTGFLPDAIKTGAQAAAIILTGSELGMKPMRALRSLNIVKGKVTENADSQLARFKTDGGRASFLQLDDKVATLKVTHPNGDTHTETFTLADAARAGLTLPSYKGEPSMYTKHPRAMLRSRVITAALKSVGWEGGTGTYDPDELPQPSMLAVEATFGTDRTDDRNGGEPIPSGVDNDTGEVLYETESEPEPEPVAVAVFTAKQLAFAEKLNRSSALTKLQKQWVAENIVKATAEGWSKRTFSEFIDVIKKAVESGSDQRDEAGPDEGDGPDENDVHGEQ